MPSGSPPSLIEGWQATEPPFRRLLVAVIVFTLGNSTDAFLLLRLTDVGFAPAWVAVLWSLHHVVKLLANHYGGQLSDRVSRRALIGTGWILYAGIYPALAVAATLLLMRIGSPPRPAAVT